MALRITGIKPKPFHDPDYPIPTEALDIVIAYTKRIIEGKEGE